MMATLATTAGRSARNQKACTSCRQVKVRHSIAAHTLSRRLVPDARKTGFSAESIPTSNGREQETEVTNQLNAIQQTINSPAEQSNLINALPQLQSHSTSPAIESPSHGSCSNHSLVFFPHSNVSDLPNPPAYLGLLPLENSQLTILFDYFHAHYYRHCPILDTDIPVRELYYSFPILFWTIIIISSRWHPSLHNLYGCLIEPYRDLLAKTTIRPQKSVEFVQAIVLLCVWPLTVPRQSEDPSWNFCGLATNAGMRMALHRLRANEHLGLSEKASWIRRKTWLALVQANCSLGWNAGVAISSEVLTSFGTPLPAPTKVESGFIVKVLVLRKFSQFSSMIASLPDKTNSWTLVQNLCKDLDSIRDGCENFWNIESDITVLGAQFGLYTLQLEHEAKSHNSGQGGWNQENLSARRNFMHLAYMAAAKLIYLFSEMLKDGDSPQGSGSGEVPQRHLPKHYFFLLLLGMAFMLKVKVLHAETIKPDQDQLETHIRRVYEILSSWSREAMDEQGRAIRLMNVISCAEKETKLNLKDMNSDGRSGVKILEDMISIGKEVREREQRRTTEQVTNIQEKTPGITASENTSAYGSDAMIFGVHESLMDWDFPWELDLSSMEQCQEPGGSYHFNNRLVSSPISLPHPKFFGSITNMGSVKQNLDIQELCHILTPIGNLGYGFEVKQTEQALEDLKTSTVPTALILDSGSTDSGPSKLALGHFTCPRSSYERDLRKLLSLVHRYHVPLIVSSAGGDGTDNHVNALLDIIQEICNEDGNDSISKLKVLTSLNDGSIKPCGSAVPELLISDIEDAATIVAQMGPEPFIVAMEAEPDFNIVMGGRSYDPSPYTAFSMYHAKLTNPTKPLTNEQIGGFTHMGKIMECGALCATPKSASAMATVYQDGTFDIHPLDPRARCTPTSVAAHALYEKSRPDILPGPGGALHLSPTSYTQLADQRTVRVQGAVFEFSRSVGLPYTVKLEAATAVGHRTTFMGGIRDPILIGQFSTFKKAIREYVAAQHPSSLGGETFWKLGFHVYGASGIMDVLEPGDPDYQPREIFLVGEVVASSQSLANSIAATARVACVHGPYHGQRGTAGNFAMGIGGKMEIEMGPCAEFCIYHLLPLKVGEETAARIGAESNGNQPEETSSPLFRWKVDMIGKGADPTIGNNGSSTVMPTIAHNSASQLPPRKVPSIIPASTLNFTSPKTLTDIAPVIRSKNSGPYEITLDVVFSSFAVYNLIKASTILTRTTVSKLYHLKEEDIIWCGFFDQAMAWKCTIPRRRVEVLEGVKGEGEVKNMASGGFMETDVHASQQYARLLSLELGDELREKIVVLGIIET
ncbi:hypothetical protein G7Y89_g11331 [Cudoniella acicularis]|uniref:Transcription factor domain-containing protein n=1 Tax=Cudoniella acicularis TaxID=354080 RepID=A0A8H4RB25_9HELO|nr:hypothetical protein G7Y89_g11331 [Cudoniella acicularis]